MTAFREQYLHIRTDHFPPLPDEDDRLVNPGMYGESLARYLAEGLRQRGFEADHIAEDFGWFVAVLKGDARPGVVVHCHRSLVNSMEYVVLVPSEGMETFSLRRFGKVSFEPEYLAVQTAVRELLEAAPDTVLVGVLDDMPDES